MTTAREYAEDATAAVCGILRISPTGNAGNVADVIEQTIRNVTLEHEAVAQQRIKNIQTATKDRLEHLLSSSPAVIYSFEATGAYTPTFVSENIRELLGYEPGDYLENPSFWRERVHPDDLARVEDEITRLFSNGVHALEYRFRRKNGSYCWVNDEQHLTRDDDGKPVEVVGSWSDISERKKQEDARIAAQTRLRHLLSSLPAVIYSFKATGDYAPTYVSENIRELLGYEPDDYLENSGFWRERVHPDDLSRVEDEITRLFSNGMHALEYRFRRQDGSYCWVYDEQRMIRDAAGKPLEVVGSWSDISERKKQEDARIAAETRLRHLLSSLPAVIYSFKATGDYAPTYISENLKDLFGYECEEYLETPDFWWRCIHPDDVSEIESAFSELYEHGRVNLEYRFRRKDEEYSWVGDEQRLIRDESGEPIEVVGSWSDITRRKQAEQALREVSQRVMESIQYASRIQTAILPPRDALSVLTAEHFLIWEPRDVVGGDFFWFHRVNGGYLIILGDCTGHGVPGAFMTLIVSGLLDQIVREAGPDHDPARILGEMHRRLQRVLGQHRGDGHTDDGLDAGACFVNVAARHLVFAGAHISLWRGQGGSVEEFKGDRPGLGYRQYPEATEFTSIPIELDHGQVFYMTTDGLIDQIGGPRRRSFGKKRLANFIAEHHRDSLHKQGSILQNLLMEHQANEMRRDDVTILGFAPLGSAQES